ncbi:uncharacterized protein LOC123314506 [Coccinella septempunctata]|uniref:uncharacterized protein LOC123314506 n=1 Tax=Coccinella septempunctata TaxID=41139 RepID=UPI001D07A44A|nr:uncharacterized protein LOC123314506 [Coccinella septempunctata]
MEESESLLVPLQRMRENASVEYELWKLTETLFHDLEICRNENIKLRKQLDDLSNRDKSFSHLHLEIEEENLRYKNENKTLICKLNNQKLQFDTEISEIEKTCEMRIKNLEEEYKKIKQKLSQKEKEFFEELQLAQTTAAYEFEKIEKKLKWQLSEANKQLSESNLINSKLRAQLENMHNTQNMRVSTSNEHTMSKNLDMAFFKNTEMSTLSVSNFDKSKKSEGYDIIANTTGLRTYEPLQVECFPVDEKNSERQTPILFKGKPRPFKKMGAQKSNAPNTSRVPPLIPCSDAAPTNTKKRKLHDPDDLSYLIDLIPQEDY